MISSIRFLYSLFFKSTKYAAISGIYSPELCSSNKYAQNSSDILFISASSSEIALCSDIYLNTSLIISSLNCLFSSIVESNEVTRLLSNLVLTVYLPRDFVTLSILPIDDCITYLGISLNPT